MQFCKIIKECLGVVIRDLQHCLVLTLCTLEHLVFAGIRIAGQMSHVGDVHHTGHIIACICQSLYQHIFANVSTQIADMCEMIYGRAAGIHFDLALFARFKFFYSSAACVV